MASKYYGMGPCFRIVTLFKFLKIVKNHGGGAGIKPLSLPRCGPQSSQS